jgi:hypothetical protein
MIMLTYQSISTIGLLDLAELQADQLLGNRFQRGHE